MDMKELPPCTVYAKSGPNWNGYYDCYMFKPVLNQAQMERVSQIFDREGLSAHVDWRDESELWVWYDP